MVRLGHVALLAALIWGGAVGCAARPVSHPVAIRNFAYVPAQVSAAVGDTVVFRNNDPVPHTVTADDRSFDSGDIAADSAWRWVVRGRGRHTFHCTYHPNMTGAILAR